MNSAKAGALILLVVLWTILPWPLVRWTALFLALFFGLGALWSYLLSRGFVVDTQPLLRTFSGRKLDILTKLENRSPLPSGLLAVFDSDGGLESWGVTRSYLSARPFTRQWSSFTVRGRERGERSLGPLTITGCDPTGMFPFVHQRPRRVLLVYPPFHPVRRWPTDGIPSGPRPWDPALVDDPSRFRSYREFFPGDPLSRLSSAAWAQRGQPHVRTYDRTVARPSGVVVDLRAGVYPLKLRWALVESAVEMAASLIWDLLSRGETVWLTVIDQPGEGRVTSLGPGKGWHDARGFLERLALATPDKAEDCPPWPTGLILPPPPLRLLWVAPRQAIPTVLPRRGYDLVAFVVEERSHGPILHP